MRMVKKISAKSLVRGVGLLAGLVLGLSQCMGKAEVAPSPVYEQNSQVIYNGSVYYNEAGCASCHGATFKGDGPDKGAMQVPDLTAALPATKTPVDYFKTITAGQGHPAYQGYTDRGRWAMAYFLYSLSKGIQPGKKGEDVSRIRSEALAKARLETEAVYAKSRRWFLGMKPPQERIQKDDPSLALEKLTSGTELAAEPALSPVDEKIKARAFAKRHTRGAQLYRSNCASCHGNYGEGSNIRYKLGLTKYCKERGRNCVAYLPTRNLHKEILGYVHAEADTGLHVPAFAAFSDEDWQSLSAYLRDLASQ